MFKTKLVQVAVVVILGGHSCVGAQPVGDFIINSIDIHPSIKSAKIGTQEAQAVLSIAKKQYLPTPSVTLEQVSPGGADPSYASGGVSQVYRLQQPLWTWGRIGAGVDKALLQASVAQVNLLDTRQQVAADTVQAWVDFNTAAAKLEVTERGLQKYIELRDLVERRIESGASAPSERATTQARLGQAQLQLVAFQTSLAMGKAKLQQLSGISPEVANVPKSASLFDVLPRLEDALAFAPSIQKAQLQVRVAEAEVSIKRAQGFPEVYARLEHQKYPTGQHASRVFVGVQSSFGAGLSNLDEAAALAKRVEGLQADEEAKRLELTQQYDALSLSLQQAQKGLPAIEQNVKATADALASTERQFLTGRRSWLDVLNAVREAVQSELELVDALFAMARAQWRLALLGMPAEEAVRIHGKSAS